MSVKPTAADLHRLRDVAAKLEQLADIVTRSQFTTDHDVAEQLYREFWIILDDLTALEKRLLIPISVGFQTVPDAIHDSVRALASFTNGVISIANGPDQARSQFFGPRGRIPLWEVSKIPTGLAAIAEQFEKIDAKRRQNWHSLCQMIESLVAEQRCRDACEIVRTFNTVATTLQLTADKSSAVTVETPGGEQQQPETAKHIMSGVSLIDVALLLSDGEKSAAKLTKKRWSNSRNPKLPESIGFDPSHSQSKLYSPSAILQFVKILETLSDADVSRHLVTLRQKERLPRTDSKTV